MNKSSIAIVFNPFAGRHRARKIFDKYVKKLSDNFEIIGISGANEIDTRRQLASTLKSTDIVIAIGGDGLVNLVIQDLALKTKPLLVHPAGTGNDFHRHNFLTERYVIEKLKNNSEFQSKKIDLVKVAFQSETRFFGQILSAGFDSLVNARANSLRYLPGSLKYILALFLEIFSFKPYFYKLTIDGRSRELHAMMVVVANGPTYGGGMRVVPEANSTDGEIDVLVLHPVSKIELLRVFPKVFSGKHISHRKVELFKCRSIEIDCNAPVYADGEYFGTGPFRAEVQPEALQILDLS